MHEMSLVQSLAAQVRALAEQHGASKVKVVSVLMGPFAGVVPDSFRFAFEALQKEDPLLAGAVLELRQPDPRYLCLDCGEACTLPQPGPEAPETQARCPACASPRLSPWGGTELILQQIRME